MKEQYIEKRFMRNSLLLIGHINSIIDAYERQGFVLTVRQLYYQLVARNIIPNNERSYQNTTSIVNDGRLAGLIDWSMIEDRTREFIQRPRWNDGADILRAVAKQFHADMWLNQDRRVFVLVEKEALTGVLEGVCRRFDVPLLACRGYPSVSVLREFAQDKLLSVHQGQPLILHLGDHDPSGIDMTRDLEARLSILTKAEESGYEFELQRIALNMVQIEERRPPPNPAKISDSRSASYIRRFGRQSWELDALEPDYLTRLVRRKIEDQIDMGRWKEREQFVRDTGLELHRIGKRWKGPKATS